MTVNERGDVSPWENGPAGDETTRRLENERPDVSENSSDERRGGDERENEDEIRRARRARRECEVCGAEVPAATYREHLLKECPGR